jgi:PAS domain S-box-containing protein
MERTLVTLGLFSVALLGMITHRIRRDTGDRVDTQYFHLAVLASITRVLFLCLAVLAELPASNSSFRLWSNSTGIIAVHFLVLFAYSFPQNRRAPTWLRVVLALATVTFTVFAQHQPLIEMVGPFVLLLFVVPYFALALTFLHNNWRAATAPGERGPSTPVRLVQLSVLAPWAVSIVLFAVLNAAFHHHLPTWVFLAQAVGMATLMVGGTGIAVLRYHLFEVRVLMTEVLLGVGAAGAVAGFIGLAAIPLHAALSSAVNPALATVITALAPAFLVRGVFGAVGRLATSVEVPTAHGAPARSVIEKTLAVTARMVDPDAVLAMITHSLTEATGCDVRFLRAGAVPPGDHRDAPGALVTLAREHPRPFYAVEHAPELPSALLRVMEHLDAQLVIPVERHETTYGFVVISRGVVCSRAVTQVCVTLAEHLALKLENHALYAEAALATRALADYRAFLEDLVESLPVGIAVVDSDMRVKAWNRSLTAQNSISREQALGAHYFNDLFPTLRDGNAAEVITELQANPDRVVQRLSVRVDAPEGTRYQDVSVAPFKDRLGHPTGVVVITQDVTARVVLEREVEESRQLAALGSFAAAIAHDIRTPLTSIHMSLQVLRSRTELTQSDREYVDIALDEAERLNRSVGEILEYARPVSPSRAPVDPREFVADLVRSLQAVYTERGARVTCPEGTNISTPIALDERLMRKVLVNLIDNAVDAAKPAQNAVVEVRVERTTTGVAFAVRDHGRGIDPAQLERIFDPFFTTRADGTGLGLAIARKIARAHGGDLRVESTPNEGATFTVTLPQSD